MILTVPFTTDAAETTEHFPNLFKYKLESRRGRHTLVNTTAQGEEELFDELIFHGGAGTTLEMRQFSKASLLANLGSAGFREIEFLSENYPDIGIIQQSDNSPAIFARRPK